MQSILFGWCCLFALVNGARPRGIIVIQADDLDFMENWTPPAHFPGSTPSDVYLPHLDRLRKNGLQMMRAYSASPMCGTSRYSTLTGRYASRAASSRFWNYGDDVSSVKIANTKLMDFIGPTYDDDDSSTTIEDGLDCRRNNLAQVLRRNGYRTGVIGKWHLDGSSEPYDYGRIQNRIYACGFSTAEAIYHENLNLDWTNGGEFTHNMEHLTVRAMEFMDASIDANEDFFMYFNPTAPHASGNVYEALTEYSCRDTVEGWLDDEPWIPGMTDRSGGCEAYRRTILQRASGDTSNEVLGAIWTDDAVGALLSHLESRGILDSTLIVFQMDHGKEGKGSIYEAGSRIAQFVHYPDVIAPGIQYSGVVSTIDVAPTILDFAGIDANSRGWYQMDGTSWRGLPNYHRCVVLEDRYDRAVVCNCDKYMEIGDEYDSGTYRRGSRLGLVSTSQAAFDLCNFNGEYITSPYETQETIAGIIPFYELVALLNCHYAMTNPNLTPIYGLCDSKMFRSTFGRLIQRPALQFSQRSAPKMTDSPDDTVNEPSSPTSQTAISSKEFPQINTSAAASLWHSIALPSMLFAYVTLAVML